MDKYCEIIILSFLNQIVRDNTIFFQRLTSHFQIDWDKSIFSFFNTVKSFNYF